VKLKILVLSLAFCCLSNSFDLVLPPPPPISQQIVQTSFVPLGHKPPPEHGDACRKWIKQLPFSTKDIHNKWHYHPAQTTCYMYQSQAHHPY